MQSILQRFWGFDKLLGPILVKIIYYLGLAAIALAVFFGVAGGLFALPSNVVRGLFVVLLSPVLGAVALVYWRFLCEIFILAFETYERLGEIRDRLPPRAQASADPPLF
jgi:hypothetical protein